MHLSLQEALELLEKRVKSRFSVRMVYLFFDYSFEEYVKIFKDLLSLPCNFKDKCVLRSWRDNVEVIGEGREGLIVT